ncbi:MAG: response regulator [Anaerolineae bacterium]
MKRCLLADDNPDMRSALRLVLRTRFESIDVSEVGDQVQLLDRLAATTPDYLILDWDLPGRETVSLERLRQIAPQMCIIVTSARPEAAAEALAARADAFVAQTDSPCALLGLLQRLEA